MMGSLPSPSRLRPPAPASSLATDYRIYLSFCAKDPSSPDENVNFCNAIECYDPSINSFQKVTSIPGLTENRMRKDFAMVALGDSVYVIGGCLCRRDYETERPEIIELQVLASVNRYNVNSGTWSECAALGTPRFNFACTVCENKIFVAGGQTELDSARGTSSAEVYDPALDEWKPLPNMTTLRYKCVGVTWQGKIHIVGGFATTGNNGPFGMERSSAEVYDSEAERWEFKARMWELDVPPNQIVAIADKLFSSGDCFKAWKGHIEVYDSNLKIWSDVDGSNFNALSSLDNSSSQDAPDGDDQRLLYLTMAPIETYLFFLAGYRIPGEASSGGMRSEVHVFDTSASRDGWRSIEPTYEQVEKMLCCHCCVLKQT